MEHFESPMNSFQSGKRKNPGLLFFTLLILSFILCISKVNAMDFMKSPHPEDDNFPRTITSVSFKSNAQSEVTLEKATKEGRVVFFKGVPSGNPFDLNAPIELSVNSYVSVSINGRGIYAARLQTPEPSELAPEREGLWDLNLDLTFADKPGHGPVGRFRRV